MKELVEAMKKAKAEGYNAFGIRVIENEAGVLNVGDACPDSYDWDYELDCSTRDTTGEKLGGACAIEINTSMLLLDGDDDEDVAAEIEKAIKNSACYYGEQVEKKILSGEDRTAEEQKFHESIANATHNAFVKQFMPVIFNAIKKGVIVMTRDKDVSADNLKDDRLIMDFIKKRNAEGARTAMRLHILHAMEHL